MIEFEGIWYNVNGEVKRDKVMANDSSEASDKIYAMYPSGQYPADCLTVVSASGTIPPTVNMNGGTFV